MDPADEDLERVLADCIAALGDNDDLVVAELTPAELRFTSVRRDEAGTPQAQSRPMPSWEGSKDELRWARAEADGVIQVIVARELPDPEAERVLAPWRRAFPGAKVLTATVPVSELIGPAIASTPLSVGHELVVLRRTGSGRLLLGGYPLFPAGARRGDRCTLTISCEPADSRGTALALVANAAPRQFRLLSVRSARITPGTYRITAELRGPGQVDFPDLPGGLEAEQRSWPELIAMIPDELAPLAPAHLICVIEAAGSPADVRKRADQVRQLITLVAARRNTELSVSVIGYGPHAVSRGETDEAPTILAWAASPDAAAASLDRLPGWAADLPGYPLAAQLECALADVASRLQDGLPGRPVLVAVGSRPPFPPRADARLGVIPCPRRRDWRGSMAQLRKLQGITFGAISGATPEDIWAELTRDAIADPGAAPDAAFAVGLGLLSPAVQRIPFPLADAAAD